MRLGTAARCARMARRWESISCAMTTASRSRRLWMSAGASGAAPAVCGLVLQLLGAHTASDCAVDAR
eukprot:7388016-Prymnesium_polylepis.1